MFVGMAWRSSCRIPGKISLHWGDKECMVRDVWGCWLKEGKVHSGEVIGFPDKKTGYPDRVRLTDFSGKNVLMLQGPMGPFFKRLACDLSMHGAKVFKINFNGGDWVFFRKAQKNFGAPLECWPDVFRMAVREWHIDAVFLYGDCRPVHARIVPVCEELGVQIVTFEEGYVRSNFVTCENGRTNGHSGLPKTARYYLQNRLLPPAALEIAPVGYTFRHQMFWSFLYHASAFILGMFFPNGKKNYHRDLGLPEAVPQIRSFARKIKYRILERRVLDIVHGELNGKYFLVPLQVADDSQVVHHSNYGKNGVSKFIRDVIHSFSKYSSSESFLIFKHHPYDRGYNDYGRLIEQLTARFGVSGRVFYIHDQPLPDLLDHAKGVIVINSTTGLQALTHGRPVKVCGKAIYDLPGLTYRGALEKFWADAGDFHIDETLLEQFISHVIARTQLVGSFYKRHPQAVLKCGLVWSDGFQDGRDSDGRLMDPAHLFSSGVAEEKSVHVMQ